MFQKVVPCAVIQIFDNNGRCIDQSIDMSSKGVTIPETEKDLFYPIKLNKPLRSKIEGFTFIPPDILYVAIEGGKTFSGQTLNPITDVIKLIKSDMCHISEDDNMLHITTSQGVIHLDHRRTAKITNPRTDTKTVGSESRTEPYQISEIKENEERSLHNMSL